MVKQRFTVVIEEDEEGVLIGTVPALKGCYSYGNSLDELVANVREVIQAHLEMLKSRKEPLPEFRFSGIKEIEVEL